MIIKKKVVYQFNGRELFVDDVEDVASKAVKLDSMFVGCFGSDIPGKDKKKCIYQYKMTPSDRQLNFIDPNFTSRTWINGREQSSEGIVSEVVNSYSIYMPVYTMEVSQSPSADTMLEDQIKLLDKMIRELIKRSGSILDQYVFETILKLYKDGR